MLLQLNWYFAAKHLNSSLVFKRGRLLNPRRSEVVCPATESSGGAIQAVNTAIGKVAGSRIGVRAGHHITVAVIEDVPQIQRAWDELVGEPVGCIQTR